MDGHVELDSGAFAHMAHRDDLARDVARLWRDSGGEDPDWPGVTAELEAALDRLAAAYGEET